MAKLSYNNCFHQKSGRVKLDRQKENGEIHGREIYGWLLNVSQSYFSTIQISGGGISLRNVFIIYSFIKEISEISFSSFPFSISFKNYSEKNNNYQLRFVSCLLSGSLHFFMVI